LNKTILITKLEDEIKQTKWNRIRNKYLLNRIKQNNEIYQLDKIYLEKITKLKIVKTENKSQQISKKNATINTNLKLKKCNTCHKEIKLDERSSKYGHVWHHELCFNKKDKENCKNLDNKKDRKKIVKKDPVIIGFTIAIFAILISGVYFILGPISMISMGVGGVVTAYYLLRTSTKSFPQNKSGKNMPSVFLIFLIVSPFIIGGMIIYEGYSLLESPSRIVLLWSMTISFFTTMLFVPLAVLSKNREDLRPDIKSYPRMSVIIPAYNEEKVIAHTIRGLLETEYPNKEIIFVDDGSTDKTLDIVNQFKGKITILHKENGGKATALNYGIACSNGEIVVIVDADTIIGRTSLKEIVKGFDVHKKVVAVAGNVKVRNRTNWITKCQALEYITGIQIVRRAFEIFGSITIIPGALGAFKKSMLEECGSYGKDTIVEDYDQTIKLLKAGFITSGSTKATAYTEAPNTLKNFVLQRKRWFRGNIQVFKRHSDALTNQRFGYLQKLSLPYLFLGMVIAPIIGLTAIINAIFGIIIGDGMYVLQVTSIFVGVHYLMTALALRIDGEDMKLLPYAGFLVFGYKQIVDILLLVALIENFRNTKAMWTSARRIGVVNETK